MKYFLIGFAIWFFIAFGIQFIGSWINDIRFWIAGRKAEPRDKWIFDMEKKSDEE